MKLSLIIPVLNEEENVPHVVAEIDRSFAGEADVELEIVFVDDGSRDATYPVLKQMAAADGAVGMNRFASVKKLQWTRHEKSRQRTSFGIRFINFCSSGSGTDYESMPISAA